MILVNNRNVLRRRNRELLTKLSEVEGNKNKFNVITETAKTGVPTLKLQLNGKTQYVHSKYDPVREAEQLMSKLEDIDTTKHMLFVGSGLGYHIKRLTELYPTLKFSIYEPDEEVLVSYLATKQLSDLPLTNLTKIFTGKDATKLLQEITSLLGVVNSEIQFFTLPIYETIYGVQLKVILEKALEAKKDKQSSVAVNLAFQTRWTINSIKNFPVVLKTPNILHDIDRRFFKGKPAIIVAAGPSLNEEFENLRHIKENGLAYIFSVGSAINALIEHGIYPDAACTYDPQDINYKVIQVIKDKAIKGVPLIFGSSVGFETLEDYPNKMLHMLVNQDTITPAFIGDNLTTHVDYVNDAPSIAVVTYQLLSKLECSDIILVGQNLAYIDEDHYAKGIDYGRGTKASEINLENAILTQDVYGNEVKTSEGFNSMRKELEMYISNRQSINTINTTKGGASILGTKFIPLENIIEDHLTNRVVIDNWYDCSNTYDIEKVNRNIVIMDTEKKNMGKLLRQSMGNLKKINNRIEMKNVSSIEILYSVFDTSFNRLKGNYFYRSFIEPMIRVQNEQLSEKISSVRYERNELSKGEVVVSAFLGFIHEISAYHDFAVELYEEMKMKIQE